MSDAADLRRLSDALVSRRCGIVTSLSPQPRGPEEPCPPYIWNATLSHFGFQQYPLAMRLVGGKGRTEEEAKLSALGEAIERYAAFQWDYERIRIGQASASVITPAECVLYSQQQYATGLPYQRWHQEIEIAWITGTELPSGEPVALPASLVYLASPPQLNDSFTAASSNGLATGKNLTNAILGGTYEVIERDAFMLTWLNRLPATLIRTPESGCNAAHIIRHYNKFGVTVRLLLLHTDQAPYVVMAIAEDPSDNGIFRLVGLGCDIDPVVAVDKSVFELCQLRSGMRTRMQNKSYKSRLGNIEAVRTLDDHALFHTMPEHAAAFEFLTQSGAECDLHTLPKPDCETPEATLGHIVNTAVKTGARVAYADITPSDIRPLGPRVVRVIITGMQPIDFGFAQGRLGGARLYKAPVDWGYRTEPLTESELNQCPHPLA